MKNNFEKGIEDLKHFTLSEGEKEVMLKNILARPIVSPYFAYRKLAALTLTAFLIFTSVTLASEKAVPGEKLYAIKTQIVEPLRGTLNTTDESKLAWEEEKVVRRIAEAEQLADTDDLDDEKAQVLEEKIIKSSHAIAQAAEVKSLKLATTSSEQKIEAEKIKNNFRKKIKVEDEVEVANVAADTARATTPTPTLMMTKSASETGTTSPEIKSENSNKGHAKNEKIKRLRESALKAVAEKREENKAENRKED